MQNIIKDKILKTEKVNWKNLKQLQKDNLKELTKDDFEKLKNSIVNNHYIDPLKVWDDGKTKWNIDGTHRVKAFHILESQGVQIPEKFTANFIDCKDKKEAAKFVTIFSSIYAKVQDEGLYEFLNDFNINFEDIKLEVDLPNIDLENFDKGFIEDEIKEKEFDENIETKNKCPSCAYEW